MLFVARCELTAALMTLKVGGPVYKTYTVLLLQKEVIDFAFLAEVGGKANRLSMRSTLDKYRPTDVIAPALTRDRLAIYIL